MGDGGKSAPVAKSSQQSPSGIPIHLDTSERYLLNILRVSMSAGWFLCHSLCLAVHCCFGIIWLGDSQCSRACRELLHKLCMAAARSALPVPHGVTSHLRCGDTHCHHACAPVLSTQREEGPRRLLTRLGDEQICPCFAVLAQSQQGGKPPNHVGQPIGAQAGTKPKSRVRGSQFCWGRQEAFM